MKNPIIEFQNFSFKYKSQTEYTLKDIDLTIYEGEKVLLLGPSGCGKSTLAHCINGLIPYSFEGEIKGSCKIASIDTSHSSIFKLSNKVGTVLQDSDAQFVGLSVGEDIAYALENDNMPRVEMLPKVYESAKIVEMEKFLEHVPYDLSGGQKQRIAIARAFLKNPPVLVLDEATSALDNKSEEIVQQAIYNLMKDRTVFIIAHRLSTVKNADKIVVIDHGEIKEMGSHEELIHKENSIYGALYKTQLK